MVTTYTEGTDDGEVLISEANGSLSREEITLVYGNIYEAGTVLGLISHGALSAAGAAAAGNTGTGTIGSVSTGTGAQVGVYKVVCIEPASDSGRFIVEDPGGVFIGRTVTGSAFTGQVVFTIADGGTDFVAGDTFNVTVTAAASDDAGKYTIYNPASTDGSETAVAVLYGRVDAETADAKGVGIMRQAEVLDSVLAWFSGANSGQKTAGKAQLAAKGIIAR